MSEISDRYRRLSTEFAAKISRVDPDAWTNTTPCDEWSVRELVGHVIDSQGLFLGLVGREIGDAPSVDEDPLAAFLAASSRVQHDVDDEALAAVTFEGFFGTTRFDDAVDRFLCIDLVLHGWDLARATGQDTTMPEGEPERLLEVDLPAFGEALHSPGVMAEAIEVPADASAQDRVLGAVGRQT